METFESVLVLLSGAIVLTALAQRFEAPYPTFLAVGGAVLAFLPIHQDWTLDPELALALFVAPVLLDAAHDASLRDMRRNWLPIAGLVIVAVGLTTTAVALVARWLIPDMPWSVAIALGAVVAPPDAAAVTAILRTIRLPHRALKVLEGESLLNDVTALLAFRLAIVAAMSGTFSPSEVVPSFLFAVVGSFVAGPALAFLFARIVRFFDDAPSSVIIQFVVTFAVWIFAERIGLSGILTVVTYGVTIARRASTQTPAKLRVPSYAVWETVVFMLNVLAFVMIGLQLRPIWQRLSVDQHEPYLTFAIAIVLTVIVVRFAWVVVYAALGGLRLKYKSVRSPMNWRRNMRGGVVISWCGMRGIVTLATAFAVPVVLSNGEPFPYRDLILLSAFCVVFGSLVVQGLTLKPLIRLMDLEETDLIAREVTRARTSAYRAALTAINGDESDLADALRREYHTLLRHVDDDPEADLPGGLPADPLRLQAIVAARDAITDLRRRGEIGDDAYHIVEQEFDWAELSAGAAA